MQKATNIYLKRSICHSHLGVGCKHAELHLVERKPNQGTCDALIEASNAHDIDILFIGSFGRKHDGAQGLGVHVGLLGTVADGSLRRGKADVCVVKSTSFAIPESAKFLVCMDFSDSAGLLMPWPLCVQFDTYSIEATCAPHLSTSPLA
jgi:hypothetical protein